MKPMDVEAVRGHFPGLGGGSILLENAGGSQVPECVADAVRDHLLHDYCQLSAGYPASDRATETVERAHRFMDRFVNGDGLGRVVLGSSCTSLMHVLAASLGRTLRDGDEIVVCEQGHEANIGCWLDLERLGATIRWWKVDPATGSLDLDDLRELVGDRTRIVAFPHVSNLLGEIVLFVAGGVLTLLVIAFVSWLLVHATREEKRRVESERSETEESKS